MTAFTVAIREEGNDAAPFQFYGMDGKVRPSTARCKPLSWPEAVLARDLLVKGAKKLGQPLECKIVEISA